MLVRKRRSIKHNKMDFNSSGNYRSDSIKFLINEKQSIKNVNKSNDEKDELEKNN